MESEQKNIKSTTEDVQEEPQLLHSRLPLALSLNLSFCNVTSALYALTILRYLISLSGALVILNVVPCYALDGQWICHAFIELTLRSSVPDREARGAIYSLIVLFGTILTILNVIIAMWTLFIS